MLPGQGLPNSELVKQLGFTSSELNGLPGPGWPRSGVHSKTGNGRPPGRQRGPLAGRLPASGRLTHRLDRCAPKIPGATVRVPGQNS